VEDVKEECQKYGPVVSLLVPKENPGRGQVSVVIIAELFRCY
jgi:U2AF family protein (UHM) kinase 1